MEKKILFMLISAYTMLVLVKSESNFGIPDHLLDQAIPNMVTNIVSTLNNWIANYEKKINKMMEDLKMSIQNSMSKVARGREHFISCKDQMNQDMQGFLQMYDNSTKYCIGKDSSLVQVLQSIKSISEKSYEIGRLKHLGHETCTHEVKSENPPWKNTLDETTCYIAAVLSTIKQVLGAASEVSLIVHPFKALYREIFHVNVEQRRTPCLRELEEELPRKIYDMMSRFDRCIVSQHEAAETNG